MELKLRDIAIGTQFAREVSELKLPIKTAYWLSKNLRLLDAELEIYNEERLKILRGYLKEGEKEIKDPIEQDKARRDIDILLDQTVELDVHMFDLEDFGGIEVTSNQMNAIDFMINPFN